jgi:aminopeptidase N
MRKLLLAASALALATAALPCVALAEAPFSFDAAPGKLPKTVVPSAYRIEIKPDLDKLTLAGRETVEVEVRKATDSFVLNQAGLTIQSATLETGATATVTLDADAQTATLRFPGPVAAGRHTLTVVYTGPIPETPAGIYYDDYKTATGEKKRMLVTQFEVADARRMFPSWDEPAFKATFHLTADLPAGIAAVSNMPIASRTPSGPGRELVDFATTPRMSTYLLALVAGDMKAVSGSAAGVAMSAWAPSGREAQGRYALEVEEQVLPFYNSYFGTPYPLPKLDQIAIPGNYSAGAMENWGAITYIDNAMLFDPATSSPGTREQIFLTVAHEMAHQWSGDLVTLGWWDNVWLNEGFATWMENKATDHFNPTWEVWPRQHADREHAMAQDALSTTHPIQQVIHDETEANSAFDGISYQKGGQVIRMIEDWIGPNHFRDGMAAYMAAHAYSNTTSADLWAALSAASGKDVAKVAAGFIEQPGVPLVQVTRACVAGKTQVTLTQGRFSIHDPKARPETWVIPVAASLPGGVTLHTLLTDTPTTWTVGGCDVPAPVKLNLGENGYFRTQYDRASLDALAQALPSLAAVDRADLLGDQYALFLADRAPLSDYLSLVDRLPDETDIAVWQDTLGHLRSLDQTALGAPERAGFDAWAIRRVAPELGRLGWDAKPGEMFVDSLLRSQVIAALGALDDTATVAEANRRFQAFLKDPASLPPALRAPVLDIVGHHADRATWETLRRLGMAATSTEEKLRYFGAMAQAQDPDLIRANIDFAPGGEIPNGRIPQFVGQVARGSGKPELVYDYVAAHQGAFAARLSNDGYTPSILAVAASGSSSPDLAKRLLAAPASNVSKGTKIAAARIADGINTRAELRARVLSALRDWNARR